MNKKTHIVFDLDGTLANTQIIHQKIESNFLKKFGILINPVDIGITYAGRSPQEWIVELLKKENKNFTQKDIDNFVDSKDEIVISLLKKGDIELMDGTTDLLKNLKNNGYKIGISSGACREFINNFIDYFNFDKLIESSTSANEVKNKKPYPDVFDKSFKVLEKKYGKPDIKWVIGDGWSDIEGGYKAKAKTIWINKNTPKNKNFLGFQVKTIKEIYEIIISN